MNAPTARQLSPERARAQQEHRELKRRIPRLSEDAIDLILRKARSHYAWTDTPVPESLLREIHAIMINGPTSMNTLPARIVFVTTPEGKARLAPALKPANVPKMMGAPVTAILAVDSDYWHELPNTFPHEDRRPLFEGRPEFAAETGARNGTLQGAYFMIAARAVGLDVGGMSGFANQMVDAEFFAGTSLKSNFLCNLGYADETALYQRLPRLSFEKTCSFA